MKKHWIFYVIIAAVALGGVVLDMISKALTMDMVQDVWPGVVGIFFTWNTGAGWSMLSDQTLLLTIFSAVIVVAIIALLCFWRPQSKLFSVGIGLVLAGAIGNLIDRVIFGAVRDFIALEFISFPVFNVADICLTVGAIILAIWLVFFWGKKDGK